jgi:hypothetical protein
MEDVEARAERPRDDDGARVRIRGPAHDPRAMRRAEERGPQEVMDTAVHENVGHAAALLRADDARDVGAGLRHEEPPRLEHEARFAQTGLGPRPRDDLREPAREDLEVERLLTIGIGHAEAASEVDGAERNAEAADSETASSSTRRTFETRAARPARSRR